MPDPVILVPPSEGKRPGGDGDPWAKGTMAVAALDPQRAKVLRSLRGRPAVRSAPTMPAIDRYTGVLYQELDAASLPAASRRRLDRSLLVVSGAFGLVAPPDPIPYYKLKMSANVAPLGKLSTWWRPAITSALALRVRNGQVWDLLPIEHSAAIDWAQLDPAERITVRFVDAEGATISHWNKLLKGSLVRWLAGRPATAIDDLAAFDHPQGYRYDPSATVVEGAHRALTFRRR